MNDFSIQTKINSRSYRDLQFKIMYSNTWIIVISIFAVLFLLFSLILLLIHDYEIFNSDLYTFGIPISVIGVMAIIFVLFSAKIGYKRNQRLHELIVYQFSEQGVICTGETFSSTFNWEKLYKIKLMKNWFLLYQNSLSANVVQLNDTDHYKVEELINFLNTNYPKIKM